MALRFDEWRLKMTENVQGTLRKLNAGTDATIARFTRMQDRLGRGFAGTRKAAGEVWSGMKQSGADLKASLLDALPIPGAMSSSLAGLAGPLGIAVGLVGVLGLGLNKGLEAAEAYGRPFRELRNLNQDKSAADMEALNDRVLGLASAKGLDATTLVTGVYDVQSTIGQFGPAVENMVADVGVAARALNMDFGQAVNGVGKALVQFKLPLSDVNRLLESNAKTVQVGVVTFDQLAQVQTEYAGAASSMNQELDTANKVFALLTTQTKNADIAATMAKAAFQDLGKGTTVEGLKKIGVNVFDANGQMRQADDILRDLVPKLGMMSDATFSKLKEEIGGSEGLRGLLDMTKASGSEVLRVFDSFDNTKFNLGEAIREANGDLDVMSSKVDGQLSAAWTRLGQTVAPVWVELKRELAAFVEELAGVFGFIGNSIADLFKTPQQRAIDMAKRAGDMETQAAEKRLAADQARFDGLGTAQKKTVMDKGRNRQLQDEYTLKTKAGSMSQEQLAELRKGMAYRGEFIERVEAGQTAPTGKPGTGAPPVVDQFASTFEKKKQGEHGGAVSAGVSHVAGGGQQVRNVTVNIQSLVKELKVITSNSVREAAVDIQAIVNEAIIRAVQGAELTLAND